MESQEAKIDFLVEVSHKLADLLKDPTQGKEMTAEARAKVREDSYNNLIECINLLSLCAHFNDGIFEIINIATKINVLPAKSY